MVRDNDSNESIGYVRCICEKKRGSDLWCFLCHNSYFLCDLFGEERPAINDDDSISSWSDFEEIENSEDDENIK